MAQPAGGCCFLTDAQYSTKLADLWRARGKRDYELDDIQGRIILHRPLMQVADQVAGVWEAIDNFGADADRVGIFGWSYGGYMTLMCMARRPDLFRVGVSGAPVTDAHRQTYSE